MTEAIQLKKKIPLVEVVKPNNRLEFSVRELEQLLTLAKDRKFKLEMGNLKYSAYYLEVEKNILSGLINKLDNYVSVLNNKLIKKVQNEKS